MVGNRGVKKRTLSDVWSSVGLAPVIALAFVAGFAGVSVWVERQRGFENLRETNDRVSSEADVWIGLLGGVGGLCAVIFVVSLGWIVGQFRAADNDQHVSIGIQAMGASAVAGLLIAGLLVGGKEDERAALFTDATRPMTFLLIATAVPGLLVFSIVRSWASSAGKDKNLSTRVEALKTYRTRLHQQLTMFGAALSLVVIATAQRRATLLAYSESQYAPEEQLQIPEEQVLLYGLAFVAALGVMYFPAANALRARSDRLIGELAKTPTKITGADMDRWKKQFEGAQALVQPESASPIGLRQFEAGAAIFAPLVTALINSALTS